MFHHKTDAMFADINTSFFQCGRTQDKCKYAVLAIGVRCRYYFYSLHAPIRLLFPV